MSGAKRRKTESMKATPETQEKFVGPKVPESEQSSHCIDTDTDTDANSVESRNIESGGIDADGPADNDNALADLRRQVESEKDKYLRLMAEFDNYKRRSAKEYERLVSGANEKLILEMVEVRENFERALKSGGAGGEFAPFYDGMKLIFAKYDEVLTRNGLVAFAEAGEAFDPMVHDALMKAPHAQIPEDGIAEVFERGYRLKDKVIKHARVVVSSGSAG